MAKSTIKEKYPTQKVTIWNIGKKGWEALSKAGFQTNDTYKDIFMQLSFDNVQKAAQAAMQGMVGAGAQGTMTFRVLGSLIHPGSDISVSKLSGPVGIGKIFWDASEAGLRYVLWIAILVNVNLAVFNLLPIPVLDGGHMLFATISRLRGKALPVNFIAATQSVFIVLLFSMIIYVSFFDVRRIVRDSRAEAAAREQVEQRKTAEPAK